MRHPGGGRSEAFWEEAGAKNYFCEQDNEELMKQIAAVRDAPSDTMYTEREAKLLEMCKALSIRPSQATKPVSFVEYYNKNWKSCSFRCSNSPFPGERKTIDA